MSEEDASMEVAREERYETRRSKVPTVAECI